MKDWNAEAFKTAVDNYRMHCLKNREIIQDRNGYELWKKMDIYLYIADVVLKGEVVGDTVCGWTKKSSAGPKYPEHLQMMEEFFGVTLTIAEKEKNNDMEITTYSDFVKENIKKAYDVVMNYYGKNILLEEEAYIDMVLELKGFQVCIPESIYNKIGMYLEEKIEPMILDKENYFADTYDESMGYFDDEGKFQFKDEEAKLRQFVLYMNKIFKGEDELRQFGMKELYPILVG